MALAATKLLLELGASDWSWWWAHPPGLTLISLVWRHQRPKYSRILREDPTSQDPRRRSASLGLNPGHLVGIKHKNKLAWDSKSHWTPRQ